MKFSDLKNEIESFTRSPTVDASSSALQEIEEKYLGKIHGGSTEGEGQPSLHRTFGKGNIFTKVFW